MGGLFNSLQITGIAKAITDVAGINAPLKAENSNSVILNSAKALFKNERADRVFIYSPDAIALWLFQKYTAMFENMFLLSDIQIPLLSVMPSVTPVCFASMYTGAIPAVHGIQAYEKPILKTDTVFDAFLRAGKKPAIVSTFDVSMSRIFLDRDMDYFIYGTIEECNKKALDLIEKDCHDLIVLYNGNYDAVMHRNGPESENSMSELKNNIETFGLLVSHIEKHWRNHRTMIGFCPDHGRHEIDGNLGSHGLNSAEDMNVIHFYKFINPYTLDESCDDFE